MDGDGSIPLVSLGYMCASGWRGAGSKRLNPAGAKVVIREYNHRALPLHWGGGIQEGPASGDHVNIMVWGGGKLNSFDPLPLKRRLVSTRRKPLKYLILVSNAPFKF